MRSECVCASIERAGVLLVELTSTVQRHAARPGKIVLLDALLVNGLLGNDVAGAEEHAGGDSLGEEGPSGQSSLVPAEEKGEGAGC